MITEIEVTDDGLIRRAGDDPDRFDAFIPSPCVQNHAANLIPLANGDLGCVWFGGTQEGMADISVHFSRLPSGSTRWSSAEKEFVYRSKPASKFPACSSNKPRCQLR